MTLTKDSAIVRIWARAITAGKKSIEDVPQAFGMRAAVQEALNDRS